MPEENTSIAPHRGVKVSPEQVIEAIRAENGYLVHAADRLDISYPTIQRYIKNYPEVAEAWNEAKERQGDEVEKTLDQLIKEKNPAAVIFYCKTRLRHRGYTEKITLEVVPYELQQQLADLCARKNISIEDLMRQVINELASENEAGPDIITLPLP